MEAEQKAPEKRRLSKKTTPEPSGEKDAEKPKTSKKKKKKKTKEAEACILLMPVVHYVFSENRTNIMLCSNIILASVWIISLLFDDGAAQLCLPVSCSSWQPAL